MKRILWVSLVPGAESVIICMLALLFHSICYERHFGTFYFAIMLVLNIYSFWWQRRRDAGEVMP